MEMMAMVYIADMALKTRRWDEDFDPKPPGLLRRAFTTLAAAVTKRRKSSLYADKKAPRSPAATRCNVSPCPCYIARHRLPCFRLAALPAASETVYRTPQAAR
ncbi:hypothetical protein ACU4I5_04715 [Ensifer adhaerens]